MTAGVRWTLAIAVLLASSIALFLATCRAAPLPRPHALDGPMPLASPPAGMALFQLPTGITQRTAAFAYRGGSFGDRRDFVMTAVLVKHPRGDLLIDTGFGRNIDAHFQLMPFMFRVITQYERLRPAAEQLDAAGYDRTRLRAIILTHSHWDHVSGVPDFPSTPVWLTPKERRFIRDGGAISAVARSFRGVRYRDYTFESGPYLGFASSRDVYGDGSIVIVPAPGHTPGSVVVFVALPGGRRYAFVGDLVWQREGISEREERPWLWQVLADADSTSLRANLLRMSAIASRFPELTVVPAHDARGFTDIRRLTRSM